MSNVVQHCPRFLTSTTYTNKMKVDLPIESKNTTTGETHYTVADSQNQFYIHDSATVHLLKVNKNGNLNE